MEIARRSQKKYYFYVKLLCTNYAVPLQFVVFNFFFFFAHPILEIIASNLLQTELIIGRKHLGLQC